MLNKRTVVWLRRLAATRWRAPMARAQEIYIPLDLQRFPAPVLAGREGGRGPGGEGSESQGHVRGP